MSETATKYFKRQPRTDTGVPRVIEAHNIHKAFDGNKILKGLSFNLHKSENLVVLGRSGMGKSVLIKCLVGLIPPDKGELCVLGQNIMALDRRKTGWQSAAK